MHYPQVQHYVDLVFRLIVMRFAHNSSALAIANDHGSKKFLPKIASGEKHGNFYDNGGISTRMLL
jgi:hypothetical protein